MKLSTAIKLILTVLFALVVSGALMNLVTSAAQTERQQEAQIKREVQELRSRLQILEIEVECQYELMRNLQSEAPVLPCMSIVEGLRKGAG